MGGGPSIKAHLFNMKRIIFIFEHQSSLFRNSKDILIPNLEEVEDELFRKAESLGNITTPIKRTLRKPIADSSWRSVMRSMKKGLR